MTKFIVSRLSLTAAALAALANTPAEPTITIRARHEPEPDFPEPRIEKRQRVKDWEQRQKPKYRRKPR